MRNRERCKGNIFVLKRQREGENNHLQHISIVSATKQDGFFSEKDVILALLIT